MARYLGPKQYGEYTFALVIVNFCAVLVTMGMNRVLVIEMAKRGEKSFSIVANSIFLRVGLSIGAIPIAIGVALASAESEHVIVTLVSIMSLAYLFRWSESIVSYFTTELNYGAVSLVQTITISLSVIGRVICIAMSLPLVAFAIMFLVESIVLTTLLVWQISKSGMRISSFKLEWATVRHLFAESWPLMFGALTGSVSVTIDRFVIGRTLSMEELGIYAAYGQFFVLSNMILSAFAASFAPVLARVFSNDKKIYFEKLRECTATLLWVGMVLFIGISLLGDRLVVMLLGSKFESEVSLLSFFFALQMLVQAPFLLKTEHVILENKSIWLWYFRLISVSFNIAMTIYLVGRFGVIGAAISGVMTVLIHEVILSIVIQETRTYLRIVISAIPRALLQRPAVVVWRKLLPILGRIRS